MNDNKNSLMKTSTAFIVATVFILINLCLNHQTLSTPMVEQEPYYTFNARAPFDGRILLPAIYYLLSFGGHSFRTGLNDPFGSTYSVFQFVVDFASLSVAAMCLRGTFGIIRARRDRHNDLFAVVTIVLTVVFGYICVPNRSLFYPYDFPELAFFAALLFLSVDARHDNKYAFPALVFFACLNKETALVGVFFYLIFRDTALTRGVLLVAAGSITAGLAARVLAGLATHYLHPDQPAKIAELQVWDNMRQLANPLFWLVIPGVFSYLAWPVLAIRRRLTTRDARILLVVAVWCCGMWVVGVARELRIFAPMTFALALILARHADTFMPGSPTRAPDRREG